MPLPKSEITAGAFYADRHDRARKILACTGDSVTYVCVCEPQRERQVRVNSFAAWAARRLGPDEAPRPHYLLAAFTAPDGRRVEIWPVWKYRWPLQFTYSLHPQSIFPEPPAASPGDLDHQIDVRDLPEKFTRGLEIGSAAPPARGRLPRERTAHIVALARAVDAGADLTTWTLGRLARGTGGDR